MPCPISRQCGIAIVACMLWPLTVLSIPLNAATAAAERVAEANVNGSNRNKAYGSISSRSRDAAALVWFGVTPASASMASGKVQQFTATGRYSDGSSVDLTLQSSWSSSSTRIASVSSSGLATGVSAGNARIQATYQSFAAFGKLTITNVVLTSIQVSPQTPCINLGSAQQFLATGIYNDGSSKEITNLVTWSSSTSSIAIVSNSPGTNGLASTVGVGTTTISASLGSQSAVTTLEVTAAALLSITVSPATANLVIGASQQFTATGAYSGGGTQELTQSATWTSSALGVVGVSDDQGNKGLATGNGTGLATVTASVETVSGTATATVTTTSQMGSVTVLGDTTCPEHAAKGAACQLVRVSCSGMPDLDAVLGVALPSGEARGTITLHAGKDGATFFDNGFSAAYLADGFRVVQLAWKADWAEANGAGVRSAACRPATVYQHVFTTTHASSRNTGFCAQGISGGGATIAYSLAYYGLADVFDYVVIAAGPSVARMDYGCDKALYTGPPRNLCTQMPDAPFAYPYGTIQNTWEHTTTCAKSNPMQSEIDKWKADSIVTNTANYLYPKTGMSWFMCATPPINESTGQATFLIEKVVPKNYPPDVNCYWAGCKGEGVWGDPGAFAATHAQMYEECVPNH